MKINFNGRSLMRWTSCLGVLILVVAFGIGAEGMEEIGKKEDQGRPDIVKIDAMKVFGDLERPPVVFLHDKHTEALAEKNKDCKACHLPEKNSQGAERMSIKYMRLSDSGKQEVMDIYHNNCIQCHQDTASESGKSGPLTCGKCHVETSDVVSARQSMGMDRSLHYRHVKAREEKCEQCHHEYDEKGKKLVYAKGKEGTCRYCHEEQTVENRISMRLASHMDCVNCHLEAKASKVAGGPVDCAGCHDAAKQEKIEVAKDIPRMKRGQPDVVFVKREVLDPYADPETAEAPDENKMLSVPFSHAVHENANDTCRACHHASLESCVACHSMTGSKDGDFVRLEGAMHQKDTEKSCLGCHKEQMAQKSCAGCHFFMPETQPMADATSCQNCHMGDKTVAAPVALGKTSSEESASENPGDKHAMDPEAAKLLEERTPTVATYPEEDIPEKVVIKILAKDYEPAELPHRKIVDTLMKGMKDNKLTQYFHDDPGTMCQGCHHNSPVSKKPPRCESCHGKPFDTRYPYKPGLMAAYHNQCMGCHDRMGVEKPASTDCTACHKEKK